MNGKGLHQSLSVCLLAGGILALILAGVWALEAQAQDEGPICPPGFEWQRMSGVGCVQTGCYDAGGRLDYVSNCICEEGMKPCYEPVDYANFDQALCGINCPGSRLIACVAQDALCPGEQPPQQDEPFYEEPSMDWEAPVLGGGEFRETVEHFLLGGHAHPPTPGRAAAAAVTGTVMMGLWSFVQGIGQGAGRGMSSIGKSGASGVRPQASQQARPPVRQPVQQSMRQQPGQQTGQQISQSRGQSVGQQAGKAGLEAPADLMPPGMPDLREAAGGMVTDVSDVIDKWPDGGRGEEAATILRSAGTDAGQEVFTGEDARLILIGMGKLPANTAKTERILVGAGGFASFTGRHASGEAQRIKLATGWEVLIAEITSVGYEDASPDRNGSVEIDFSRRLTLVARLGEDAPDPSILEAPTLKRTPEEIAGEDIEAPTILRRDLDKDPDEDGEVQS